MTTYLSTAQTVPGHAAPLQAAPVQHAPTPVPMPVGQPMPGQMMQGQTMPRPMPMPTPMAVPGQMAAPVPMPVQRQVPQVAPAPLQAGQPIGAVAAPMTPPVAAPSVPQQPAPASALPIEEPPHEGGEVALPAITIHAFCDRQDTAGVINESTRDWRMKRTNMKIFMGGLTAAIEFYRKESTPALILIETGMRGEELFAQLGELASVCEETTKVVVVGAANDIRLYRRLMDAGVSDYLVPPFHPIGLIRSLGELYSDPDAPFTGRVCAFFGAKGGVGSSTIAHNVAWQLSESLQQDTALVDLDTSWGTTGLDFHYDQNSGLEEALSDPSRLDETLLDRIMIRHTPRLSILPASGGLGRGVMDKEAFESVVSAVRGVSPLTVLDLPHLWSEWTESVLTAADDIVITASLDLANLRNAKNLIDFLKTQRPNDPDPILVVNNVGLSEMDLASFGSMVGLEPSVTFEHQPKVFMSANNAGEMITDTKVAPGAVEGLQRIAHRLKTGSFPAVGGSSSRKPSLSIGKPKATTVATDDADESSKSVFKKLLKRG